MRHLAQPIGTICCSGMRSGMPEVLMVCLARLMHWAMAASGTRKAAAICAVVRPPTARSVRAIRLGADNVGWQHRNSSAGVIPVGVRLGVGYEYYGTYDYGPGGQLISTVKPRYGTLSSRSSPADPAGGTLYRWSPRPEMLRRNERDARFARVSRAPRE